MCCWLDTHCLMQLVHEVVWECTQSLIAFQDYVRTMLKSTCREYHMAHG